MIIGTGEIHLLYRRTKGCINGSNEEERLCEPHFFLIISDGGASIFNWFPEMSYVITYEYVG